MDFTKSNFDFIGKAKIWYGISIFVIVCGIVGMFINIGRDGFPLKRGIDFAGGSIIQLQFENWDDSVDRGTFAQDIKNLVAKYTDMEPQVQNSPIPADQTDTGNPALLLHIRADASLIANQEAQANLYLEIEQYGLDAYGGTHIVLEETEVGAVIGKELAIKALTGVMVGLILILLYITIRLSFDFAVFAVVALFHDVLILCGIYALLGFEINSPFVAVLLTVVGYSINDTIIIYDRIRENQKVKQHLPFDKLVNQSLLETMPRSINTSLTTLLAITALLIFGGESLKTFMLGLGIGVLTGTYSSIFVASILLVTWRLKGKGTVFGDEGVKDAASIILSDEGDLMEISDKKDLDKSDADEEEEEITPITVDKPPPKPTGPKRKPKRRHRRH